MKKIVAFLLLACMMLSLAACGSSGSEYKLGMGVDLSTDSSKENNAQVDATVAAVVTDKDGKIVACRLDVAQSKMDVTGGAVDAAKTFQTKMELGDDYGMVAYGNAIAEWYDQAKAFESYVVGKTAAEVEGIETVLNETGHNVATDEALLAGCTMDITAFKAAVVKACNDEKGATFTGKDFTLGVAAITAADESTAATDSDDAEVKMYTEYAAAVVGKDGKILAALTDATQPKITADKNGQITGADFKGTKRELGADYGMVAYGNAIAEWDAQAKAFADYTVGKTAAEVAGIETVESNGHNVTTDETLYASCTMDISGMIAVIALAANYAR
ncbi:MAG: hypothetical protein SPI09_09465 [Candidatus Limivicinus sp.]|nr:hypothetical protein [Clostridiales bacterium]MDY6133571.1 hypothetical protein [Candidatus Limivicinus sp.]